MIKKPAYDPRLAGLRGLAALSVVLYHVNSVLGIGLIVFAGHSYLPFFLFSQSVSLFFVLSIYLLLKSLDGNQDLWHYFKRRIFRIWPIYFGAILVAFAVLHQMTVSQLIGLMTFTYYRYPFPSGTIVFWSLEVEELMYIVIPLIWRAKNKELLAVSMIVAGICYITILQILGDFIYLVPSGTIVPWFANPTFISAAHLYPIAYLPAYGIGIIAYTRGFPSWLRYLFPPIIVIGAVLNGFVSSTFWANGPFLDLFVSNQYYVWLLLWVMLPTFGALVFNPPRVLSVFALLGEFSYALYALQLFFIFQFGILGVFLLFPAAFCLEFLLRPREIWKRVLSAYPRIGTTRIKNS